MRNAILFLLVLSFSSLSFAGMDCDIRLMRQVELRSVNTLHRLTKRFDDDSDRKKLECLSFGRLVLSTALDLYCEAGDESVPCEEATAGLWVSVNADKDHWANINATSFTLDSCGMARLEAMADSKTLSDVPKNLRLCPWDREPWDSIQTALEEELRALEENAKMARSR